MPDVIEVKFWNYPLGSVAKFQPNDNRNYSERLQRNRNY